MPDIDMTPLELTLFSYDIASFTAAITGYTIVCRQ